MLTSRHTGTVNSCASALGRMAEALFRAALVRRADPRRGAPRIAAEWLASALAAGTSGSAPLALRRSAGVAQSITALLRAANKASSLAPASARLPKGGAAGRPPEMAADGAALDGMTARAAFDSLGRAAGDILVEAAGPQAGVAAVLPWAWPGASPCDASSLGLRRVHACHTLASVVSSRDAMGAEALDSLLPGALRAAAEASEEEEWGVKNAGAALFAAVISTVISGIDRANGTVTAAALRLVADGTTSRAVGHGAPTLDVQCARLPGLADVLVTALSPLPAEGAAPAGSATREGLVPCLQLLACLRPPSDAGPGAHVAGPAETDFTPEAAGLALARAVAPWSRPGSAAAAVLPAIARLVTSRHAQVRAAGGSALAASLPIPATVPVLRVMARLCCGALGAHGGRAEWTTLHGCLDAAVCLLARGTTGIADGGVTAAGSAPARALGTLCRCLLAPTSGEPAMLPPAFVAAAACRCLRAVVSGPHDSSHRLSAPLALAVAPRAAPSEAVEPTGKAAASATAAAASLATEAGAQAVTLALIDPARAAAATRAALAPGSTVGSAPLSRAAFLLGVARALQSVPGRERADASAALLAPLLKRSVSVSLGLDDPLELGRLAWAVHTALGARPAADLPPSLLGSSAAALLTASLRRAPSPVARCNALAAATLALCRRADADAGAAPNDSDVAWAAWRAAVRSSAGAALDDSRRVSAALAARDVAPLVLGAGSALVLDACSSTALLLLWDPDGEVREAARQASAALGLQGAGREAWESAARGDAGLAVAESAARLGAAWLAGASRRGDVAIAAGLALAGHSLADLARRPGFSQEHDNDGASTLDLAHGCMLAVLGAQAREPRSWLAGCLSVVRLSAEKAHAAVIAEAPTAMRATLAAASPGAAPGLGAILAAAAAAGVHIPPGLGELLAEPCASMTYSPL